MEILCDRCGRKTHYGDELEKDEMNLCEKCVDVITEYVLKEQDRITKEAIEYFMANECPYRLKRM